MSKLTPGQILSQLNQLSPEQLTAVRKEALRSGLFSAPQGGLQELVNGQIKFAVTIDDVNIAEQLKTWYAGEQDKAKWLNDFLNQALVAYMSSFGPEEAIQLAVK